MRNTVDGFICMGVIFSGFSENDIFVGFKLSSNIDVCETLMPPFPNMTFDLDL